MNTIQKLLAPLTIAVLMVGSALAGTAPPSHAVAAIDTKIATAIGEQTKNGGHQNSRIKVRFEHGGYQTVNHSTSNLHVGDRVDVDNKQISRELKP
jgi:hypothetical protein